MTPTDRQINADWLESPAARTVTSALEAAGHAAFFVGGCVRNALLGVPVTDLDLSTDATPERVMSIGETAGMKVVPTGFDHGTVTLVHDATPIEVTTFRADVETHGRHATVRFSTDIAEDAARRDFTMNALYASPRGEVVDPLGSLQDLDDRRVRFVGDASERVAEDYLRILRFFRFHAWYADPVHGMDPEGLAASAMGADGLAQISAERIGHEIRKLLAAPHPAQALAAMEHSGVLGRVLPGSDSVAVSRFVHLHPEPDPMARLAALGGEGDAERLRLSRSEARRFETLRAAAMGEAQAAELGWRLGADEATIALAIRSALAGQPLQNGLEAAVEAGAGAVFPVTAQDLMPVFQGAALGARLKALEAAWIASDFALSRDDLLALPPEAQG